MEIPRTPGDGAGGSRWTNLLNGATALNSAPAADADGVEIPKARRGTPVVVRLRHSTTAGNDARTCTIKLWGWCAGEYTAAEVPIASSSGWDDLNLSYSLPSVSADGSLTAFVLEHPAVYDRFYVEVTAITGTGTAISCAAAFTDERD